MRPKNKRKIDKETGIVYAFFTVLLSDFSTAIASGVLAASIGIESCRKALNGFSTK